MGSDAMSMTNSSSPRCGWDHTETTDSPCQRRVSTGKYCYQHGDMEYEKILNIFSNAVSNENPNQNLIRQINQIKSELESKYWSSNKVFSRLGSLYSDLDNNQQQLISSEHQNLQSLYTAEESDRSSLKSQFKNTVHSRSEEVIEQQSDRLLRRVIAAKNESRRQSTKSNLVSALETLQSDLESTDSDLTSAKIAIATGDEARLSNELSDFSHVLERRGWDEDDLESLIEDEINKCKRPVEFLEKLEHRTTATFDFLVFLPIVTVNSNYTANQSDFEINAAGELDVNDLPNANMMTNAASGLLSSIQETLDNEASIEFQIEAWESEEAKKKASDKVSQFLDSCAGIHQAAYLEDLQYQSSFRYMVWRSDQTRPPFISMFRDPDMPASLSKKQLEHIDEFYSTVQSQSPLANRLSRAVHYFRKGNIAYRNVDATVNYIACLETLTTDSNSVRDDIYTNALQFGRVIPSAENQIIDILDQLYRVRNAALHSGSNKTIDDSDISLVQSLLSTIIWDMVHFLEQNGPGTLADYINYVTNDIHAKYRYLFYRISNNGLQLDHRYSVRGEAISQTGSTQFEFDADIEFVDENKYIWIDISCSNIQDTWNSIGSDQILDVRLAPISGTQIQLGQVKALRFMHSNSTTLESRDFDII